MAHYQDALQTFLPTQIHTIQSYQLPHGETVWIRKIGKRIPPWRYQLLGMVARSLRLGVLQPVPNLGGQAALDIEAQRLQQLTAQQIPVPRLLACVAGGIMFSDLGGSTLLSLIENHEQPLFIWQQGLVAISQVHAQQAYLSQAFARNMIYMPDEQIGFIDFEDDPAHYMSLIHCQSRDWLCYLQSTALWLKRRNQLPLAAQIWQQHYQQLPKEIQFQLHHTIKKIRWLQKLHHPMWGNDTLRLAALAELFFYAPQ